jgi:hypothetical protein
MSLKEMTRPFVSSVGKLRAFLAFCVFTIWRLFDRRDLLIVIGLGMLWYGLSLYSLSLAYSIIGGIIFVLGIFGPVLGGKD